MFENTTITKNELKEKKASLPAVHKDILLIPPIKNIFKVDDQDTMKWEGIPVVSPEFGEGRIVDMPQKLKGGIMVVDFGGKKVSMACPQAFHPHADRRPDLKESILHTVEIDVDRHAPHGEDLEDLSQKMQYLAFTVQNDLDDKKLFKKSENGLLTDEDIMESNWRQCSNDPAQAAAKVDIAELFELMGFLCAPEVMRGFSCEVPSKGIKEFEKDYPGEKYTEIVYDKRWGKEFRISIERNIDQLPPAISGLIDANHRVNNNYIGSVLLGTGVFHLGYLPDPQAARDCAQANGYADVFDEGYEFGLSVMENLSADKEKDVDLEPERSGR